MKTFLFSIFAMVVFSQNSFSQTKTDVVNQIQGKKGWWCRKFTITAGCEYISISTEVLICFQPNGYGGFNATFEKDGTAHATGYIKTSELIESSSGKISSKQIESVIVTKINPEEIEGAKWMVKPEKNKIVTFDDETYLEVILEKIK